MPGCPAERTTGPAARSVPLCVYLYHDAAIGQQNALYGLCGGVAVSAALCGSLCLSAVSPAGWRPRSGSPSGSPQEDVRQRGGDSVRHWWQALRRAYPLRRVLRRSGGVSYGWRSDIRARALWPSPRVWWRLLGCHRWRHGQPDSTKKDRPACGRSVSVWRCGCLCLAVSLPARRRWHPLRPRLRVP